ncbi:MAG: hypothetical protein ACOC7S_02920 [Planctomycetota bacterium]
MRLRSLSLDVPPGAEVPEVTVRCGGRPVPADASLQGERLIVGSEQELPLTAGDSLELTLRQSQPSGAAPIGPDSSDVLVFAT